MSKKKPTVSNHTILLLGTDNLCATSYTDDSGASVEKTAAQARKFPKPLLEEEPWNANRGKLPEKKKAKNGLREAPKCPDGNTVLAA